MPIKDNFPYTARWESVGLDCSDCVYFLVPESWPDKLRASACSFHKVSLAIEIGKDGYKCWEWFCSEFSNIGSAQPQALAHFESLSSTLKSGTLYRLYSDDGFLIENEISGLLMNDRGNR